MIVLMAVLESNSESDADRYHFETKLTLSPMEFGVLSFSQQHFSKFKQCASQYSNVKDWERECNFMVCPLLFSRATVC